MIAASDSPGIHGKLPSHGDFITRRLPREFVDGWDDWLQHAIAASKAELGETWLDTYLTSPIWSFVLGAGICGANAWAGVLMPSVDRVGRYFPLTLAVSAPPALSPCEIMVNGSGWFERARGLALSSLEQDEFSLDAFDASVAELGAAALATASNGGGLSLGDVAAPRGLCLTAAGGPEAALMQLTHGLIEQRLGRYSAWWSDGSELVPACVLLSPGLPAPAAYTALLDGRFSAEHWLATEPVADAAAAPGAAV
jgi:type VI secretion system protein ImpM